MNRSPLPAALVAIIASAGLIAQDPIALRVSAETGTRAFFRIQTKLIDIRGQEPETRSDATLIVCLEVTGSNENGSHTLELEILRTVGRATLPALGNVEFDSVETLGGDDPRVFARVETTKMNIGEIKKLVELFYTKNGRMPQGWDDLIKRDENGNRYLDVDEAPKDAWDNEFVLQRGRYRNQVVIRSLGADGREGTADDITSPPSPAKAMLAALAGRKFTATVTSQGNVKDVDNLDGDARVAGEQVFGRTIHGGLVTSIVEALFVEMPEQVIAGKPSRHETSAELRTGVSITTETTTRVEAVDDASVRIDSAGAIKIAGGSAARKEDAIEIHNAAVHGKATVSREDGMVLDRSSERWIDVTMPASMGGAIRQKTLTSVERISAAEAAAAKKAK